MNKHTPGPWRTIYEPPLTVFSQEVGTSICAMYKATNPNWEANARLIAAAPDLLAACEKTLEYIDYVMACAEELPTAIVSGAVVRGQEIEAAIAKARGETST